MADMQDIFNLLDDVNAELISEEGKHKRYRLPNGFNFVVSKTPSDYRSADNSLAVLRRELRQTHPEVVQSSYKNFTPPSRFSKRPSEVRTFTPEQIATTNLILHEQGKSASDAFIAKAEKVPLLRQQEAVPANDSLGVVINKAQNELHLLTQKIAEYTASIQRTTEERDRLMLQQITLEEFLGKFQKLMDESVEVLRILPVTRTEAKQIQQKPVQADKKKHYRDSKLYLGSNEIHEIAMPVLQKQGKRKFTVDEVMAALHGQSKLMPDRRLMANTIYQATKDKRAVFVKSVERGFYQFKEGV